jgi:hypothetical protein
VLAYLARYTHRVAISNARLVGLDKRGVSFGYKDYRRNGRERFRAMTLLPSEFIRRFLLHVLPKGFHRIDADPAASAAVDHRPPCPSCGGRMIILETFQRGGAPRGPPSSEAAVRATMP